jgi:crotonobetainyl-CoA:carnitine CoA-transferase CaiB-like acyl-CoA transferase
MPAVPVADLLGAWSAVTAILAALLARQHSGRGAHLDAALFDAAVHGSLTSLAEETAGARGVGEPLSLSGALPCYNLYRARDGGLIALAALERKFWRRFCDLVGRRDLIARQYDTSGSAHREVAEVIARRDRDEWRGLLNQVDLPAEPVLSVEEALSDPQARQRAMVERGEDRFFRIGFPVLFDAVRPRSLEPVPELGEHTGRLLVELGLESKLGSKRQRRRGGVGARRSLRRLLWRWSSR